MNEKIIKNIIQTRNAIRKKYAALKSNKLTETTQFEKIFKPITTPLKRIADTTDNKSINFPLKKSEDVSTTMDDFDLPLSSKKKRRKRNRNKQSKSEDVSTTFEKSSTPISSRIESLSNEFHDPLEEEPSLITADDPLHTPEQLTDETDEFIRSLNIDHKDFDLKLGPHFSPNENVWKIGSSTFIMDNQNFYINDKVYNITPGLKDLIFLKHPETTECTDDDISKFIEIVKETNLLHREYDKSQQFAGSAGFKYNLIKKFLVRKIKEPVHTGLGLMQFSKNKTDYVYWDNPNELVGRLRLLLASQQAGHSNHNNEIISILEELKEANIII